MTEQGVPRLMIGKPLKKEAVTTDENSPDHPEPSAGRAWLSFPLFLFQLKWMRSAFMWEDVELSRESG
jgi:hypothetical protein